MDPGAMMHKDTYWKIRSGSQAGLLYIFCMLWSGLISNHIDRTRK